MLRQDAGLPEERHEVRVRAPPRHDVQVDMVFDPGPRDLPLIHADIEPFGRIGLPDGLNRALQQTQHVQQDRFGKVLDGRDVPVGRDQEMAVVVRVDVHEHVRMATPPENERLPVLTERRLLAKDAAGIARDLFDEGQTPGGPNLFHAPSVRDCSARRAVARATSSADRGPRGWSATRRRSPPTWSRVIHRWSRGSTPGALSAHSITVTPGVSVYSSNPNPFTASRSSRR